MMVFIGWPCEPGVLDVKYAGFSVDVIGALSTFGAPAAGCRLGGTVVPTGGVIVLPRKSFL